MKQAIINYQRKEKDERAILIGLIIATIIAPLFLVNFAGQIAGFFIPNEENYTLIEQVATNFAETHSTEAFQNPCISGYNLKMEDGKIVLYLFGHTCERVDVNLALDYNIVNMSRPYDNILAKCFLPVYTILIYLCIFCGIGFIVRPVVDYALRLLTKKTSAC